MKIALHFLKRKYFNQTIGSALDKYKGIGPGFDFLRIALALAVLYTHSIILTEGEHQQLDHPPIQQLNDAIVPMFFALSGFLIAGSAIRLRLKDFILNRAMRIVPALAVDIFVSALVIGLIFTTLPLKSYFSGHEFFLFHTHFTNVTGWIHYTLPGVFENNRYPKTINGSLWTVTFEIGCYILMCSYIVLGLLKRRWAALFIFILIWLFITFSFWANIDLESASSKNELIFKFLYYLFLPRGKPLYIYFLVGVLFYLFRDKMPYSKLAFVFCLTIFACGALQFFKFMPLEAQTICYPVLVYMTIFIGLTKFPRIPIYSKGDYSYGIYLYGYPLQQAIIAAFPKITSSSLHFVISILLASMVAMMSWHFIEKPILGLRRKFSFTARKGEEKLSLPKSNVAQ